MRKIIIILIFIISGTATITIAQNAEIKKGKRLAEKNKCTICHREGGLASPMNTLAEGKTSEFLKGALLNPAETLGPDTKMPAYPFNEQEIEATIAYLQSLSKE